jgi:hypothetical protein
MVLAYVYKELWIDFTDLKLPMSDVAIAQPFLTV